MVAVPLLLVSPLWTPPNPPGRKPIPQYKGVEFRLQNASGGQRSVLVNRTNRKIDWTTGGYEIARFAQPVAGGKVVTDGLWPTWKRPTEWSKTETLSLPARRRLAWGGGDIPSLLKLKPGRYHVWEIFYPAFETETWLTSNAVGGGVP